MLRFVPVAFLVACSAVDPDPRLEKFAGCDDLNGYMQDMALQEARWRWATEFQVPSMSIEYAFAAGTSPQAADFSQTNLQEQGVDEADLVKTDGTWLYSVAGPSVAITKVWPMEAAGDPVQVPIDGIIFGLYLVDDTVITLSTVFAGTAQPRDGVAAERTEDSTLVTVIDVTDRAAPVVIRETYTSGILEDTRRIGDRLYVVTYTDVDVQATAPVENWPDAKRLISAAVPADWLPRKVDHRLTARGTPDEGWTATDESSCGCDQVYASKATGGTFVTNVLSLDLADLASSFVGEAVVGRADTVYASPSSLYVAYTETAEGAFATFDGALDTVIHKFTIGEAVAAASYDATAKIVGTLPDQFALSEHDGVLRVATTDTQSWSTNVYTLQDVDGEFTRLDVLRGLAPGENLFAARFVGDVGYLVTYVVSEDGWAFPSIEGGDPLFTIDLADPTHVQPIGELQLDGWSDYIHPIDEGRLLTVGMDDGEDGWQVAVSVFDVSDLAAPALVDRLLPGSFQSEARLDHHAFNWYEPQRTLALPGMDQDGVTALDLVKVGEDGHLTAGGKLYQAPELLADDPRCAPVRRSVFLEDEVWAVSSAGLTGASLADPETPTAWVAFAEGGCASSASGW